MSFISDYVTPFLGWYDAQTNGQYLSQSLRFKGGKEAGVDYFNKVQRSIARSITAPYLIMLITVMTKPWKALNNQPWDLLSKTIFSD